MVFYTDNGRMFLAVELNPDYSSFFHHKWSQRCCKAFTVLQLGGISALRRHWRRPVHGSIGPAKDMTLKTGAMGV